VGQEPDSRHQDKTESADGQRQGAADQMEDSEKFDVFLHTEKSCQLNVMCNGMCSGGRAGEETGGLTGLEKIACPTRIFKGSGVPSIAAICHS
jgi:hypothetical protein